VSCQRSYSKCVCNCNTSLIYLQYDRPSGLCSVFMYEFQIIILRKTLNGMRLPVRGVEMMKDQKQAISLLLVQAKLTGLHVRAVGVTDRHRHGVRESLFGVYIPLAVHTYIHTYIHTYLSTYTLSYTYLRIHKYIHTFLHTYIHTYMHTYIYSYIHIFIHTYKHTHVQVYVHTYTHTHIRTCIRTYVRTYIHTCKHTYIHIHT
jgi:hypothetical protein